MIEVKNLNKTYDRRRPTANHVLKDVSFTLPDTGFVCILGPSGCGKTSLLNAIGGLDRFDNGRMGTQDVSVTRYGTSAYERERNRSFGYIFQNYYLLEDHSVAYNVYLGLHSLELSHKEKMRRVRMALQAVDMERYIRRTVSQLSGGQQQRVAIARALVRRPKVIFADEPTGNLDEANTRNICALLRKASKESLVIMVTHEERIARFYADRIITLTDGRIDSDIDTWDRSGLSASSDKILYAGDYIEQTQQQESLSLRFLRQEGAPPVQLTVVAMHDRVVIKLDDPRPITVSASDDSVSVREGKRPLLTLESVDAHSQEGMELFHEPPAAQCRAGKGVTGGMMLRQSRSLVRGKGIQKVGLRAFLILLTVLALFVTGDYIAISRLDPEDFITADSHILEISMSRGNNTDSSVIATDNYGNYWQMLQTLTAERGAQPQVLPTLSTPIQCTAQVFYQMSKETLTFPACSVVFTQYLDESTILYGRMPQKSDEIVIDRQVLEALLEQESTIAKSIDNVSFFLGMELTIARSKSLHPVIVGICDSGERSIYMSKGSMVALTTSGVSTITLSELKSLYPGKYGDLELAEDECAVFLNVAGEIYKHRIGQKFYGTDLTVTQVFTDEAINYSIVANDSFLDRRISDNVRSSVRLYCADKEQTLSVLRTLTRDIPLSQISETAVAYAEENPHLSAAEVLEACIEEGLIKDESELTLATLQYYVQSDILVVNISDPYTETYRVYERAATVRADGRTIVITTLLVLSLVMLYLLCRAQVHRRTSMLAVYRLLGIPKRKLYGIFAMEAGLSLLRTLVPTTVIAYYAFRIMGTIPEIKLDIVLSFTASCVVAAVIAVYYLFVSLLPLRAPLHRPPASLAAKYDM